MAPVDLARYRDAYPDYYGQASLSDVAADLHRRFVGPDAGLSLEDFNRQNGFDGQIAAETGSKAGYGLQPATPPAQRPGLWSDAKLLGKTVGQGLYSAVADVFPKTVAQTVRGGDVPLHPEDTLTGRVIAGQDEDLKRWELPPEEADRELFGLIKARDVQAGLQNLGYSAGSMAAGMGAGAAAGSIVPGAGTLGGAVAGSLAAGAAGGLVGYRATKDQFLDDIRQRLLKADPGLTEEKWREAKQALDKDASLYGLWEAIPEAVGDALTMGIIKTPVGKMIEGIPFIRNRLTRSLASAGVKLGLDLPVELGTESWTQHEQGAIEARNNLREAAPTWGEAFDEVAPQTTVLSLATMGLGHAAERFMPSARAERRAGRDVLDLVHRGEHRTLSDEDLGKAYATAYGLYRDKPGIELQDAVLALDDERARRNPEPVLPDDDGGAPRDAGGPEPGPAAEPEPGPEAVAPEATEPDRAAELGGLTRRALNDLAGSLGIARPGRLKRDDVVAAVLDAERQAGRWYEPDALEARYREAHAAPFPDGQDRFLEQAGPVAQQQPEPTAASGSEPVRADSVAARVPLAGPLSGPDVAAAMAGGTSREIPLVEVGAGQPAATPSPSDVARPALAETVPAGSLPTEGLTMVEAGTAPSRAVRSAGSASARETSASAPVTPAPVTPGPAVEAAVGSNTDLAGLGRTRLNALARELGLDKPGRASRTELEAQVAAARQAQASEPVAAPAAASEAAGPMATEGAQAEAGMRAGAPEPSAMAPAEASGTGEHPGMSLHETRHARKGHPLYVVTLDERLPREGYDRLKTAFSALGGYWSNYKGRGAIPGIQFADRDKALTFLERFGKLPAGSEQASAASDTTAGEAKALPETSSQAAGERELGPHATGEPVFEPAGDTTVKVPAPVPVRPTRAGVVAAPREPQPLYPEGRPGYLTREERTRFAEPTAQTGRSKPQGAADAGLTQPDQSRPDLGVEGAPDLDAGKLPAGDLGDLAGRSERPQGGDRPGRGAMPDRETGPDDPGLSVGRGPGDAAVRDRAVRRTGPDGGRTAAAAARGAGAGDLELVAGAAGAQDHGAGRRDVSREHNHRIAPDDVLVPGGNAVRARANVEAIRLLRRLEAEDRLPTPDERRTLARFSGWGSLAEEVFKEDFDALAARHGDGPIPAAERARLGDGADRYEAWKKRYGELHPKLGGLLAKDEWDAARRSTLNAHYTDRDVVTAMWDMVRRLGFKGGVVVEPAAGIGHFFGLMPQDLAEASRLKGVELDTVTGRMLQKLYPAADIQVTGFQDARRLGHNTADLVISNVPFGDVPVNDKRHKDYSGWSVHNYFLARALDTVRPGGLVAAITSHFTMDTSRLGKVREYLGSKADLVGAVRLPATAFAKNAGTEVVTDILVLRKKDGHPFDGQPWRLIDTVATPQGPAGVNEYFVAHPEMVLGRHSLTGSMYGGNEYTVLPDTSRPLTEQLQAAVAKLPADVMAEGAARPERARQDGVRADEAMKEGTLVLRDGRVYGVEDGTLVRPDWLEGRLGPSREALAREYVGIKSAARDLVRTMLSEGATEADIRAGQKALARVYDPFVKKHGGFLDNRKLTFLRDDVDYPNVLALEKTEEVSEPGGIRTVVAKADIFTCRTIRPFVEPETAGSPEDAVKISLLYHGAVDGAAVGRLLGISGQEARGLLTDRGLVFENPETGLLETPGEYLSGNVRGKLEAAKNAAEGNPDYRRNVAALTAVQPPQKPISRIDARLGATWIPDKVVAGFMAHLGVERPRVVQTRTFSGDEGLSSWTVGAVGLSQEARNRWTVNDTNLLAILEDALNLRLAKAYRYEPGENGRDKRVVDQEATLLVQEKQKALQAEFLKYVRETPEVAGELEKLYDAKFGGQVPRLYEIPDVAHYPGAVETVRLRDHQKRGVARGLRENTLFAHGVGAGKTYLVATLAMEARRLGTARKPMIVVQGATLEQFASAFKRLYPAAGVLAPNAEGRTRANRQRLLSRIATGDWDAVIVPHSFFNGLAISPERERAFLGEELDGLRQELREARSESGQARDRKSPRVKQIEKMILKRETRLQKLLDARKDENVFFEDTGVDMLVVDEAHAYKRGDFYTKMDNVKGLDRDASQRSMQLLLKSRYVSERTGGKNVHLATGTPVSNTLAELWTMLRYIRPDLLERFNVTQFDDFASIFCSTKTDIEETATGDYKPVTRFNRYQNLGELTALWKAGADIVLAEDMDGIKDIPRLKGGRPQEVSLERGPGLAEYIQHLKRRRADWEQLPAREKRSQPHVPLVIHGLAQKAALDLRLVNPDLEAAPGGKIEAAAGEIHKRYLEHADTRAAQVVFSDIYKSADKRFNVWKELKRQLVARGIPANEIAIIYDYGEKAREKLFADVNAGRVRVVMGSTEKLGVGVNIQERLAALHHLSPPVRPMDWEQRNGRIRRQGNRFPEVEILAYGVRNTLDSVSFNILQNKQKFINQLLRGEVEGDVVENPFDDVQLSFEDMMAAFSGNPLAMERVRLESQVRDLGRLRQAFADEKAAHVRKLALLRDNRIPALERNLKEAGARTDALRRGFPELKAETFRLKDGDFDKKGFTAKLTDWFEAARDKLAGDTVGGTVAHYETVRDRMSSSVSFETGGYDVTATVRPVPGSLVGVDGHRADGLAQVTDVSLTGSMVVRDGQGELVFSRNFNTPGGFLKSFGNGLAEVVEEPRRIEAQIAAAKESAASLTRLVGEGFSREDEYREAGQRLKDVEAQLKTLRNEDLEQADTPSGGEEAGSALRLARSEERTEAAEAFRRLEPVRLTGNEIGDFTEPLPIQALRRAAVRYVGSKDFQREVTNRHDGSAIRITPRAIKGALSHGGGPQKIQAVAGLPAMLERAVPVGSRRVAGSTLERRYFYASRFAIDGREFVAGLVVREDANGRRFYDHELSQIESPEAVIVTAGPGRERPGTGSPTPRDSVMDVVRRALGVNIDIRFTRGEAGGGRDEAVAGALRQGLARFPALSGLVDVYRSEADLSPAMRREIEAGGLAGKFHGVYDPSSGRIVFVTANIPSERAAQAAFVAGLLRHEGRHAAFDRIFGGEAEKKAWMNRAARAMPRQVADWLGRNGLASSFETRAEAAEEILVSFAREGTAHRLLDRLLAKVAAWVRTVFPSLALTKAELRRMLAVADDFVEGRGLSAFAPAGASLRAAPVFARESGRFARFGELTGVPDQPEKLKEWLKGETMAQARSMLATVRETKETGVLGRILRSPEYWKHPVLKRLYEIFRDRSDRAHELLHAALDAGEGRTILQDAAEALRDDRQRGILSAGVDHADVHEIEPEAMETWFAEHGAKPETIALWRTMRQRYDMLLDARLDAYRRLMDKARRRYEGAIVKRLVAAGIAPEAAKTFEATAYNADRALPEALASRADTVAAVVAAARKDGLTIGGQLADIRLTDESGRTRTFSLAEAVERMGQLRGFYAPRLRETGEYVVRGSRTGTDGRVERFRAHKEWRGAAESLRARMERDGWAMEPVSRLEKLPEATQQVVKALELAKTVESAARRVGNDVDTALVEDLVENLAEDIKARGFRAQSIKRSGRHGEVVGGYLKDAMERFTRYAGSTAYGLAKMEAAGRATKALFGSGEKAGIDIRKERDVYRLAVDYLAENLRNAEAGDRLFALAKSVASLKYLGLSPRSALVNLTSMATTVPAALHAYALEGKGGFARIGREVARSMWDYLGRMTGKWGRFSADEGRFLDAIRRESLDDPQFAREALSTYRDTAGKTWTWLMAKSLALFGATEQLNRGATLLAAYRLARAAGADEGEARARARETSDRAHGVYDRSTQPVWTWGTSAGARLGQSWYIYKKYGHNYLQLVHELFGRGDWRAAVFALSAPMVLGGLGSQVLTALIKGVFAAAGADDDPEKWVYDTIRKNLGGEAEDLARFGLLGLVTGTDLSGSLGTMIDMPDTWSDVLGPMGGLVRDVLAGVGYLKAGQPGRAAEKLLPTGAAKAVQAVREAGQGVTTAKNYPVIGEDGRRLVPTGGESVAKALGFRPLREARARNRTSEAVSEERRFEDRRDQLYSRFRVFRLDGAKDPAERKELVDAVNAFNRDLAEAGLAGRVSPMTRTALLRQTERLERPTGRERARLAGEETTARPIDSVAEGDIEDLSHPYYGVRRTYLEAKQRYDALLEAGDRVGARRLRAETRLPRLHQLVERVQAVHEAINKLRRQPLPEAVRTRRLERLRRREHQVMDRAAALAAGWR